jgi:flagellar biosynthesis protein FlhF
MQVKRYEVQTMKEAMLRIKRDLGPDAIILSTKKLAGSPPLMEVMAARDERTGRAAAGSPLTSPPEAPREDLLSCVRQEFGELKDRLDKLTQQMGFQKDLTELRERLPGLFDHGAVKGSEPLRNLLITLLANGIQQAQAIKLVEKIHAEVPGRDRDSYDKGMALAEGLIARSLVGGGQRRSRRIVALIGPTGVGKTTTLAKLAAHYSIEQKKKVGLITTDTFRIAAAEQLKIYAQIMGLPIQIASESAAFQKSLAGFADMDLILVDTPGRNQNDEGALRSLKDLLGGEVGTELLLSPVASRDYLLEAADRFRLFNYERIILTKVDETSRLGSVYELLADVAKPVSFLTTGQNVPRDIEPAQPARLAKMILHHRMN